MAEQINKTQEQRRIISGRMLLLCMSGLLINIIFAHLARIMATPVSGQYRQRSGSSSGRLHSGNYRGFPDQPDQWDLGLFLNLLRISDNPDCHGFRLVCRKEILQFSKALAASGSHCGFCPDRRRPGFCADLVPLRVLVCLRYFRAAGSPPFLRGNRESVSCPALSGSACRSRG